MKLKGMIALYNVKVFKYPSGWQVRAYSRPVGVRDYVPHESPVAETAAWNEDIGEWENVRYNPDRQAIEPFTYQLATRLPDSRDAERSALSSLSRTKTRVYHLSRSNLWDWFFTLTFDPARVDSFDYAACTKALKGWLDAVRRKCPDMKYLIVPEKHKSGRFHFHGLFAGCDSLGFTDSGYRDGGGQPIYNIGRYGLGWSTATKVQDNARVTQYISKYVTKELCTVAFGKKRYWASRNLDEADTEEYFIDGSELEPFMDGLGSLCSYEKEVVSSDMTVHYYEMGVELLENDTLEYALRCMCVMPCTHVVVRSRDNEGVVPIGGGTLDKVVSRFGKCKVTRCFVVGDILYVDVE